MDRKTNNKCIISALLTRESLLLLLLAVCTFFVYSRSIKGPFVFDDIVNIQENPQIRIIDLALNGMLDAGFKSPCPNRPVANMSFALNYYFNRYDTASYHLINILMHILTGIILFYLIKVTLELLGAQNLKFRFKTNIPPDTEKAETYNFTNLSISTSPHPFSPGSNEILFLSFFAAFIWLVHPLQTQTVSYIVQRMNGMAAMFYVISLLFYIKARQANFKRKKSALFLGCVLSGILALGSKEIAATLPIFIFLYEWYFFQDLNLKWLKHNSIYLFYILLIIGCIALYFLDSHPIKIILSAYNIRDFTLWQRVFTEFRVVILYISLLILPMPIRLNLLHDVAISNSFINPITTLYCFIAISGLIVAAVWLAKRERLISFCILWFFGNLVVESSVIGLEIIFEHRVYLPSMFFILLLVSSVYRFAKSKWIPGVLLCSIAIIFSVWTYQRNIVWSSDVILWEDCIKKSPNKPRQHYNLGVVFARNGKLDEAIQQYRAALNFKPDYIGVYYNLGNAYARKGDTEQAIYNYRKALHLDPDLFKSYYNIAKILFNQGKIGEAIQNYQKALTINHDTPQTLYNLSWIYATSENSRYRNGIKALKLAEKLCMLTGYQQPLALDALAAAYAENGNYKKAVGIAQRGLELALQVGPKKLAFGLEQRLKLYEIGRPFRQSMTQNNES